MPPSWRLRRLFLLPATLLAGLIFTGVASAQGSDLALNQPVAASSHVSGFGPGNAVDSDTTTEWEAAANHLPDWLRVDLGTSHNITEVQVQWGADYPTSYKIQVSNNKTTWTNIYSTTSGNGGTDDLTGLSGSGRYVRVKGLNQSGSLGNSIYDLQVFDGSGSVDSTPPTIPTGLTAAPGDGTVSLSWSPSSDNGGGDSVTGYDVYQDGSEVAQVSGTSYTATGLTDGTSYGFTVDAYDAAGNQSAQSSSVSATPQAATTGHTVPASPTGPATPSGGWSVEYADAFGSCLMDAGTSCSAGYPRQDGSWVPQTNAGGYGNSNEIEAFEPSHNDITAQGLVQTCTQTPNLGDNYTCAAILGNGADGGLAGVNGNAPAAPNPFYFDPKSGTTVIQYEAQLPVNQGNMDPSVWENSKADNPEVDNAEWWGMHKPPSGSNTWCGMGWAFPAIPFGGSMTGNGNQEFWCNAGGPSFDPSAALHTYTIEFNNGTYTGWIDGTQITTGTYTFTTAPFKLLIGNGMRKDTATGLDYPLPSGGATFTIPYIAVYEASSANGAGSNGPMIEPGTTIN